MQIQIPAFIRSIKLKYILLFSIAVIFITLIFFLFKINQFYKQIYIKDLNKSLAENKKIQNKNDFNFLILGYGGAGHDGPYLTDTLILFHLDIEKKKAVLISFPRDVWVKVPTNSKADFHAKVNSLYQMGIFSQDYPDLDNRFKNNGINLVKYAIFQITGLTIDNYIAVDFTGFASVIEILGGVDVNVEKTFDDYEYPINGKEKDLCGKNESDLPELGKIATDSPTLAFPCRYEHLHFDAGMTHMDGQTALKYVRSRHSLQDGTDFGRAARQQKLLEAVKNKVLSIGFIPKIIPLMDQLKNHVVTDFSINMINKLLKEFPDSRNYKLTNYVFSDKDYFQSSFSNYGGYILIPKEGIDKWSTIRIAIQNLIK